MLRGEYCQTLDVTGVATGWTETGAVRNKARVHVFAALRHIREALPFPLRGIDPDNGPESIDHEPKRHCEEKGGAGPDFDGIHDESTTVAFDDIPA